jgi:hypothetical protein
LCSTIWHVFGTLAAYVLAISLSEKELLMRGIVLGAVLLAGVGLAGCDSSPSPVRPDEGTTGTGGGTMNNPGGRVDAGQPTPDSPQGTTPAESATPQATGTAAGTATPADGVTGTGTGTATPATPP